MLTRAEQDTSVRHLPILLAFTTAHPAGALDSRIFFGAPPPSTTESGSQVAQKPLMTWDKIPNATPPSGSVQSLRPTRERQKPVFLNPLLGRLSRPRKRGTSNQLSRHHHRRSSDSLVTRKVKTISSWFSYLCRWNQSKRRPLMTWNTPTRSGRSRGCCLSETAERSEAGACWLSKGKRKG